MWFSNYGDIVHVHGWGWHVTTLGYGDAQAGPDPNTWYTLRFAGTSSASRRLSTGAAAACIQSYARTKTGSPLTPAQVRDVLIKTGTPQEDDAPRAPIGQHIGPLPNLPRPGGGGRYNWIVPPDRRMCHGSPRTCCCLDSGPGWRVVSPSLDVVVKPGYDGPLAALLRKGSRVLPVVTSLSKSVQTPEADFLRRSYQVVLPAGADVNAAVRRLETAEGVAAVSVSPQLELPT